MWPDRVSNSGPLTYESGALPTALRGSTSITEVFAQCIRADCDLDFRPSDMVLICNILTSIDDFLCQLIFKSHLACQSYVLDTVRYH